MIPVDSILYLQWKRRDLQYKLVRKIHTSSTIITCSTRAGLQLKSCYYGYKLPKKSLLTSIAIVVTVLRITEVFGSTRSVGTGHLICYFRKFGAGFLRQTLSPLGLVRNPDGRTLLVVAGGKVSHTVYLASTEILDLETNTWSTGPDLPEAMGYGNTVQYKNTFIIVGGYRKDSDGSEHYSRPIYRFNPENHEWEELGHGLTNWARAGSASFLVSDDDVYCCSF